MGITTSQTNGTVGLWSLIIIGMCCVVELILALSTVSVCLRYADVVSRLKVYNQLTTLKNQDIQKYSNVLDDWSTSDVSNMNSEISQNEENPEDRDAQDEAMENEQTGEQMQLDDAFDMQNQVEADAEMDIALNQYDYDAN